MEPVPDSTAETVTRAQRGDDAAFEQLVREFDDGLRVFSHRVLGPGWTEDVLQEAYLRAFRALPQYRAERGSFRSWLYRIIYRSCLDELRRARRQPLQWASGLDELRFAHESGPDVAARDSLWRAWARSPARNGPASSSSMGSASTTSPPQPFSMCRAGRLRPA